MTSPQRVRAAFDGVPCDRTPVCEQAFASSVASEILGYNAYTGSTDLHYFEACAWLDGDGAHDEFVEKCYQDVVALHRALKFDIFFLPWRMTERPTKRIDENSILYGDPDGSNWRVYAYDPHSRTYGLAETAQRNDCPDKVIDNLRKIVDKHDGTTARHTVRPILQRAVRELSDEFVVAGDAFCALPLDSGWLEATVLDPGLLAAWFEIVGHDQAQYIQAQHDIGIWLINGGGDLAFNSGLAYSPKFFEQAVAPAYRTQFKMSQRNGQKYIFRSDGDIWAISDLLFGENCSDAYYEIDHHAGMTFDKLRAKYPELVLMGNVPCDLLHSGTPAQIREFAAWCKETAGSRLILGSSNSILHGTSVENVYALYE
ncbi:MAG: hypothetical protein FWE06_02570 [Oscillospiraceae bacterium]|nr:hypothetical protein [Oscillospiraceae bacterium]